MPSDRLTREEVLAMEAGPEMDREVARRVLWIAPRAVRIKGETNTVTVVTDSRFWLKDGAHSLDDLERLDTGRYSTYLPDTWRVIEKFEHGETMPEPGWSWPVEITRIADSEGPVRAGWCVSLAGHEATASAFPLAVCRAALLTTIPA